MFNVDGSMRKSSKHMLKNTLKVDVAAKGLPSPDYVIIDGCAMLWYLNWDKQDTVQRFVNRCINFVERLLANIKVSLIFDRYFNSSIKRCTHEAFNTTQCARKYKLSIYSPLPQRNVILTNSHNKDSIDSTNK